MTFWLRRPEMRGRTPRERDPDPRPESRIWTAPDGVHYHVWLAAPAGHLVMHGRTDMMLTFVDMRDPNRQLRRSVPAGTELERMTDQELGELLRSPLP